MEGYNYKCMSFSTLAQMCAKTSRAENVAPIPIEDSGRPAVHFIIFLGQFVIGSNEFLSRIKIKEA